MVQFVRLRTRSRLPRVQEKSVGSRAWLQFGAGDEARTVYRTDGDRWEVSQWWIYPCWPHIRPFLRPAGSLGLLCQLCPLPNPFSALSLHLRHRDSRGTVNVPMETVCEISWVRLLPHGCLAREEGRGGFTGAGRRVGSCSAHLSATLPPNLP